MRTVSEAKLFTLIPPLTVGTIFTRSQFPAKSAEVMNGSSPNFQYPPDD